MTGVISSDQPAVRRRSPLQAEIRLMPGTPFYERQRDMDEFLLAQDPDSMLYNFRKAAGLPTLGAAPMTGWDADECKLKGHTTGHYMSGLALAYASTGDERFRSKLEYIVGGLRECRDAFAASGRTAPGFVSAYDEEQFDLLEQFTKYPEIWAPYYTLDKIMAGLLDAYELAGIEQAMDILKPLGDWVWNRLSRLDDEVRSRMWAMYIAGEYGAMIGTMVRLYRHTGDPHHLAAAKLFDNPALFEQMAAGRDELDTMHANQHIPQIIGALELYRETGDVRYYNIAENFECIVTGHHCYANGGTGEQERFHEADREIGYLTDKTAESCASYNMLRLTSALAGYAEDNRLSQLMDYYENTLFNHILMSFSHHPDGGTTYFLPLASGSTKYYERDENSCCHGTGMETRYRFMTQICSYEDPADDGTPGMLLVNLPVSCRLNGDEQITVSFTEDGKLTVRADCDMKRKLAVRVPAWCRDRFPQAVNGYLQYDTRLRAGESVTLELPMEVRQVPVESDQTYSCLAWGPYLLAAVTSGGEFISAPDPDELREVPDKPGEFTAGDNAFRPLYRIDEEAYHIYMKACQQ
ncbi:MAG: glycoside hydrolase family 127 protein [Mogibacterium sp.]|nr:glycoside hydrolase family 127 protein [Mogibacterium sp.]